MEWWKNDWVVYDLETTGIDTDIDRVVQIGTARFSGGEFVDSEQALCYPGVVIPPEATAVHGITDDDVTCEQSDTHELTNLVAKLSECPVILTYNGFGFDDKLVESITGIDLDEAWGKCARVDVLTLVRTPLIGKWWKGKGRHRLGAVAERLGVEVKGELHGAAVDAETTGRILVALLSEMQTGSGLRRLPGGIEITDWMKRTSAAHEADFHRWLARQPKQEPTN
jgi:DNA polymerase III subunit epsilon